MKTDAFYKIDSYKKINIIFILLIMFIFFYSLIFNFFQFGLQSSCEGMPLVYCKSRGLTRAFNQIILLRFDNAIVLNPYSIKIFIFFFIQLLTRFLINIIISAKNLKLITKIDIFFSTLFFLFCFYNLITI